jgi:hypothetical protein
MNFSDVLAACLNYSVSFIVVGGHARDLLNKNLALGIAVSGAEKDLDLVVSNDQNFLNFVRAFNLQNTLTTGPNLSGYKFDGPHKTDLILDMKFRRMIIDEHFIPSISYATLQNHCQEGELYNYTVKYADIAAYYGMIKSTGLLKYKDQIEKILTKYPDVATRVRL